MDCNPPGSSVHGILQSRILEWVVISFCRGSSQPKDQTQVSCIAGGFFTFWSTREAPFFSVPVGFWVPAGPSVVCYSVGLCQASGSSRYPSVEAWLFPISGEGRALGYRPRACRCFQTESRPCQVSAGDGEWSGPTGFGMMPSRFLAPCLSTRHRAKHPSCLAVVSPKRLLYLVGNYHHPRHTHKHSQVSGPGWSLAKGHPAAPSGTDSTLTTAPQCTLDCSSVRAVPGLLLPHSG